MNRGSILQGIYKMERSYEAAIQLLNIRRRLGRPISKEKSGSSGILERNKMPSLHGEPSLCGTPSLGGMRNWLQLLGHSDAHLESLGIIHVSGTKGKGSTCAFAESLIRAHGKRTGFPRKSGMYTSPHLICLEERIRIDSAPISKDLFAKYVFEVWDCLSRSFPKTNSDIDKMPRYLQLLALTSFHTFIREGVDVAIYETHHGGEYDATNVIRKPVATGIAKVGMDHVNQLGPSIENIAWHKAGIFKPGTPAFSTLQEPAVAAVLQSRASEKGVTLEFVGVDTALPTISRVLKPEVQRENCSLALALVGAFLEQKAPKEHRSLTSHDVIRGVEQFFWPGRFQQIVDGNHQWFLDGAHNELSGKVAAQWFAETATEMQSTTSPRTRILIFSQISGQRDGALVLECIAKSLRESRIQVQHVILTTYEERQDGSARIDKKIKVPEKHSWLELQKTYGAIWERIDPAAKISYQPTIEGALKLSKSIGERDKGMQTLVTGSLYLVGGALHLLDPNTLGSLADEETTD